MDKLLPRDGLSDDWWGPSAGRKEVLRAKAPELPTRLPTGPKRRKGTWAVQYSTTFLRRPRTDIRRGFRSREEAERWIEAHQRKYKWVTGFRVFDEAARQPVDS